MTKEILAPLLVLLFSFLCFGQCFERSPLKTLQDRADFVCPPGEEGFFFVEPCTQFYYYCTAAGGQYQLECPAGTVFDPYQPTGPSCVSPEDGVCEDPAATTTEPTDTTTTTSTTTMTTELTTELTTEPPTSTTDPTTITTESTTITSDEPTTTETTKTTVTFTPTPSISTTTRTPNTCGNSSTTNSFTCPDGDSGQYPYDDCSSLYWQCSNGMAYLTCCPANLVYNPALNVCDYYYNVDGCNPIKSDTGNQKQPENKNKMESRQRNLSSKST
ncbi:chondroitin proteoglycan 1-like [Daphnia pulex]|uniref:chondroitin proteoglycan 1-like n=1 Tax=Daphnia pulex TaxID=6669 RepID=UPI001EE1210E|nr:chondroitin proteoglycan 1-like [Daphnia pulex]